MKVIAKDENIKDIKRKVEVFVKNNTDTYSKYGYYIFMGDADGTAKAVDFVLKESYDHLTKYRYTTLSYDEFQKKMLFFERIYHIYPKMLKPESDDLEDVENVAGWYLEMIKDIYKAHTYDVIFYIDGNTIETQDYNEFYTRYEDTINDYLSETNNTDSKRKKDSRTIKGLGMFIYVNDIKIVGGEVLTKFISEENALIDCELEATAHAMIKGGGSFKSNNIYSTNITIKRIKLKNLNRKLLGKYGIKIDNNYQECDGFYELIKDTIGEITIKDFVTHAIVVDRGSLDIYDKLLITLDNDTLEMMLKEYEDYWGDSSKKTKCDSKKKKDSIIPEDLDISDKEIETKYKKEFVKTKRDSATWNVLSHNQKWALSKSLDKDFMNDVINSDENTQREYNNIAKKFSWYKK